MNALELQAIRHIFAMTVEESARYIARDDNVVAWQQWEKGEEKFRRHCPHLFRNESQEEVKN
jgi:DNA-binding transcriptional regulator YiaG